MEEVTIAIAIILGRESSNSVAITFLKVANPTLVGRYIYYFQNVASMMRSQLWILSENDAYYYYVIFTCTYIIIMQCITLNYIITV